MTGGQNKNYLSMVNANYVRSSSSLQHEMETSRNERPESVSEIQVSKVVAKLNARIFDTAAATRAHGANETVSNGIEGYERMSDHYLGYNSSLAYERERFPKTPGSGYSSRRSSDDAGRAKSQNADNHSDHLKVIPTNHQTQHHHQDSWGGTHNLGSTSTTNTDISEASDECTAECRQRRRSHESALPKQLVNDTELWRSADNLVPDAAFGSSLADIMESPANRLIRLRDEFVDSSSSALEDGETESRWQVVRHAVSAVGAFKPTDRDKDTASTALPGTPLPSFQSKDKLDDSTVHPMFDNGDRKTSQPNSPDEKDEYMGEMDPEGLDPDSLMFRDGRRKIDMVLAYEQEDLGVMTEAESRLRDQRKTFEANLIKEGLELELENKCLSFDGKTWFLKIHIPWRTEVRLAEVIGLKLPVKRFITISVKAWQGEEKSSVKEKQWYSKFLNTWSHFYQWDHARIEEEPSFYGTSMAIGTGREEQFLVKDRYTHYASTQRSLLVMQILLRTKFDSANEKMGIRRLINDKTYIAYFPLHEGRYDSGAADNNANDRRLLYLEWARPCKWYKKQPIWLVKSYFGEKIGLYFCWLGFYTKMLYAPALVGTLCFLYGLLSMNSKDNIPSKEICDASGPGNTTLCPLCDKACQYQRLSDSCMFARLTYLFDNPATVFFAIFMSFWATTFLELWKRKQTVLRWEWDLAAVETDEDTRPEFETSVKTYRINPVTREKEPYLPAWSKTLRYVGTSSAVLFMICIVMGAVLGTIIYRISLVSVIYGGGGFFIKKHAKIFTSMTAALINLVIIMILTRIYANVAVFLTNMENPRTQSEYEDSYTFKIFFFEFMNFYSSLIYIAFFKGRFYDYPGDDQIRKSEFYRLKGDICDPAGCLSELCIQLAIIMIGKQSFNNFMEILYPKMYNWWRQRSHRAITRDLSKPHMAWEQDYHLQDPGRLALFDEYLEMIMQYGFVTLFVAAFPLAPLFALLNNIAEIRLDAYKFVTQSRRPLAERVEDIGAWYGILKGITYASVVSNAFVIGYTSDFIPRMVYKYVYSPDKTLTGYIDHSLSLFNTSDYRDDWGADANEVDPAVCAYRGYRNGPRHSDPYGLSPHYWHVFAARLAFVVIFEHFVFGLTSLMSLMIPDVPSELRTQMQREALLAKEAKYEHGLRKGAETSDYDDVMNRINANSRAHQTHPNAAIAGSWARRLSKISDGLDAHVAVIQRPTKLMQESGIKSQKIPSSNH